MSTTITSITIEKVRGIDSATFVFDTPKMIANKFHILVAPNGFGKTSFAGAFSSLKPRSLKVPVNLLHKNEDGHQSKLEIKYCEGEDELTATADDTKNEIAKAFQVAVIGSRLKPEAKSRSGYIQWARPGASLVVDPVVLVEEIPKKPTATYSYSALKTTFGQQGKVLPNIGQILEDTTVLIKFLSLPNLHDLTLKGIWKKVDPIRNEINQQRGSADQILTWIEQKKLDEFRALDGLASVASLFVGIDQISETQSFLAAFQLARLYADDAKSLKQYGERINYQRSKKTFIGLLENVNSNPAWISVGVSENKGQLIASFPAATDMSNGQRDLLSFVAQLLKALYSLTGDRAILIIDEVFDYLDEANLLAAQFFATRLIEAFKSRGAEIFPLILTHLDPLVFRHSILGLGRGDMRKVHFLAKADDKSRTLGIAAMVKKREDAVLKPLIGKHFFHYHPQSSDQKALFRQHGLKESWGISNDFYAYVCGEFRKYGEGIVDVDFVAACVGARISIEKHAFDQLTAEQQTRFTDEFNSSTREKLDFAEEMGAKIPLSHHLLGLLYNDALHHKEHSDYISPIVAKMNNGAIRGIMKELPVAF